MNRKIFNLSINLLLKKEIIMSNTNSSEKKKITQAEYQKRVEMETESLKYFNYMRHNDAVNKAKEYVETKFVVG